MKKEILPVIMTCSDCGREFLIASGKSGTTEIHEVFKQNRKWNSSILRITREEVPLNVCPFTRCGGTKIQIIGNSKAQRIWRKI
jgi:hypothetical protein